MNKLISLAAAGLIALGLSACNDAPARKMVQIRTIVSEVFTLSDACYLRTRPEGNPDAAPTLMRFQGKTSAGTVRNSMYELCKASKPGDLRIQTIYVQADQPAGGKR
ncbi:MAG: hypothetical protein KBC16_03510 [Candidatus Pacebacteria bacterium]|nr:hypothetical protein [Candidatus Paceibacterota bacterium]